MVVVVLSVVPERLRGALTRWLLEISVGVYVGHLPARVREQLWLRIVEDVGKGRALMVWSRQGEQRLDFRSHNHAWETVDVEGITLMRRQTAESQEIRGRKASQGGDARSGASADRLSGTLDENEQSRPRDRRRNWSRAARRRRFRNAVEQRHQGEDHGTHDGDE
jgi:CRISPR-associated protein Cas2